MHTQCVRPACPSDDGARPGPARPIAQHVDSPRHCPHDVQGAVRVEVAGGWMVGGKILAGRVHGPWRGKVAALETD
jgi:hypothetical protein